MAEIIDDLEQVITRIKKGAESIESANDVVLKVTDLITVLNSISDSLGVAINHNENTSRALLNDTAEIKNSLLEALDDVAKRLVTLNGLILDSDEDRKKLYISITTITQLITSHQNEMNFRQDTLDSDLKKMLMASITENEYTASILENLESLNTNFNIQSRKITHLEGRIRTFRKMATALLILIVGGVYANYI